MTTLPAAMPLPTPPSPREAALIEALELYQARFNAIVSNTPGWSTSSCWAPTIASASPT